jgi:hypothetical protein
MVVHMLFRPLTMIGFTATDIVVHIIHPRSAGWQRRLWAARWQIGSTA